MKTFTRYLTAFTLVASLVLIEGIALEQSAQAETPGALLLDAQARDRFAKAYMPASVVVHYFPPLAEGEDEQFRVRRQVRAVLVDDGSLSVLAPAAYLRGASKIEVERFDGKKTPVTAKWPTKRSDEIPLVVLVPVQKDGFKGLKGVKWADPKKVVVGLRVWGVELSATRMPDGERAKILLDAQVGKAVEYPLERFFYVGLGRADGQALLTADGTLACVVYRTVPGTRNTGLCTSKTAALKMPPRKEPAVKELKLTYPK